MVHLRCTSVLLMQSKIVIKLCIFIYEPFNGVVYNFKFYVFWYGFVLFQGLLEQLLCLSAQAFFWVEFQVVRAVDDFVQGVEGIFKVFGNKAKAADDCDLLERFRVVEGSVKFQSLLFCDQSKVDVAQLVTLHVQYFFANSVVAVKPYKVKAFMVSLKAPSQYFKVKG